MAYDLRKPPPEPNQRPPAGMLSARERVQMKHPAHPIPGVVVDDEPLVVGGLRYWLVAWRFGGEERVSWSPESAFVTLEQQSRAG
jgi:hypothetical protein